MEAQRIYRSGVRFDCPDCGKLWKDDAKHSPLLPKSCAGCGNDLRMVGRGEDRLVGGAKWFRCLACKALFMNRRGEIVPTTPRLGFKDFTEF